MSEEREILRVGFVEGVTLTRWRRVWAERHPEVALQLVELDDAGSARAALDGWDIDLCFVRLPLGTAGMQVVPLYTEVAVVVVPRDHPASLFESVTLADLSEEALLDATAPADPFDLVAAGAGVLLVPHAVARSRSRPDLVFRPVTDAEPTQVALAWLRDREHPATQDFVGVVRGRTVNSSRGSVAAPEPSVRTPRPRTPAPAGRRPARRRGPRR